VAITCQPRFAYSSAIVKPSPREAPTMSAVGGWFELMIFSSGVIAHV